MKSKGRVREKWAHDKGHNEDFVFFSFSFFFGWDEILLDVWRSPGNPELLNFILLPEIRVQRKNFWLFELA